MKYNLPLVLKEDPEILSKRSLRDELLHEVFNEGMYKGVLMKSLPAQIRLEFI